MPYRRRYTRPRRRPFKRTFRRSFKKRTFRKRTFRRRRVPMVHLKAIVLKDVIVTGAAVINKGYAFSLQDIANSGSTTYTNFEEFRMNKVVITVIPTQDTAQIGAAATAAMYPTIIDGVDYTDSNPPATTNDILRIDNSRIHVGNMSWNRKFTPAVAVSLLDNVTAVTASAPKFKQWVTTTNANILDFNGYKLQITPVTGSTTVVRYNVWAKIYYSLKRTH